MALAAATLVVFVVLGPASQAAPEVDATPEPEPEATPGGASDVDRFAPVAEETAKEAFDRGLAAAVAGEYATAVEAFEKAHGLSPHPATLFNLALALEKAGRLTEAWGLFDGIIEVVDSNAERREIRRHMRAIEDSIAIVEIDARPQSRLCIDGLDMPAGKTSDYRLAIEAGRHELLLDAHAFDLEFTRGDRRVLLLDEAEDYFAGRRRGRLMPAMIGTAIGLSGVAVGLGVGAALASSDGARTGLAAGAAGTAGLALAVGIVALLVETRAVRDPTARPADRSVECPGSPELEQRIDLRLAPTIVAPPEFTSLSPTTPGPSLAAVTPFPHPHGLVPPRASARP